MGMGFSSRDVRRGLATVAVSALFITPAAALPTFTVTDLGDLPGGSDSVARGINDAGQVVGVSDAATGNRAFLWEAGSGMVQLDTLIDALDPLAGLNLRVAVDINSSGQIAATGRFSGGAQRAYLLTPVVASSGVTEPSTVLLLGAAVLTVPLAARGRRLTSAGQT